MPVKDFFSPTPKKQKQADADEETQPEWVKVKQERSESLEAIKALSAAEFEAQWGDQLRKISDLRPAAG
jgi:hypothetical protein